MARKNPPATTHDGIPIVGEVTPESMMGDNPLEKEVNAYLTKQFISHTNIPADECLYAAREVIRIVYNAIGVDLVKRIHENEE